MSSQQPPRPSSYANANTNDGYMHAPRRATLPLAQPYQAVPTSRDPRVDMNINHNNTSIAHPLLRNRHGDQHDDDDDSDHPTRTATITGVFMFATLVISIAFVCTVILGGSWSVARAELSLPWVPSGGGGNSRNDDSSANAPHVAMAFGLTSYSSVGLGHHPKTVAYSDLLRSSTGTSNNGNNNSGNKSPSPHDIQLGPIRITVDGDNSAAADANSNNNNDNALTEPVRHLRIAGIVIIILLVFASVAQVFTLALVSCATLSKVWVRSYEHVRANVLVAQTVALVALVCAQIAWLSVGMHAAERFASFNQQSFGYFRFEHAFGWCFWLNLANAFLVALSLCGFYVLLPHELDAADDARAYAAALAVVEAVRRGASSSEIAAIVRGGAGQRVGAELPSSSSSSSSSSSTSASISRREYGSIDA